MNKPYWKVTFSFTAYPTDTEKSFLKLIADQVPFIPDSIELVTEDATNEAAD